MNSITHNKKGWYFTFDAILFSIVVLGAIYFTTTPEPEVPYSFNTQVLSEDLLGVMSVQKVSELEPALYVQYQGNFTDQEYTLLEQVGQWWADDDNQLVADFMQEYTDAPVRDIVGLSLHINEDAVYQEPEPTPTQLSAGLRVVSGVEKAKPVRGAVASAHATKVRRNRTLVVSMSPEGAGYGRNGGDNFVNLTKVFELPENITIIDSSMVVSIHADRNLNDRQFFINNCSIALQQSDYLFWAEGDVGTINISSSCIGAGNNTWTAYLSNSGYNGHTHPGTYLYVDYTEDTIIQQTFQTTKVNSRYYLDYVLSERDGGRSGAWTAFPFEIPRDATNISAAVFIRGTGVRDYTGSERFDNWNGRQRRRNYDYQVFLNDDAAFDWDANPSSTAEYYYPNTTIVPMLTNGTNVLSVFFNNYMDAFWGNQDIAISNNSYVELNYTVPISDVGFGLIDVSASFEVGGSSSSDKTMNFSFPEGAVEIFDAHLFLVQQYSNQVTVWADPFSNPTTEIFDSPAPRAVPSDIIIPKEQLERLWTVQNYVRARDIGSGNHILGTSRILYEFSVPASVGFGDVFPTQAEAEADAIARLQAAMGPYVDATNIETSSNTITDVPTLWGPAEIEVRAWQ